MFHAPQRLVHESLLASAAELPDKEAVIDASERRTYAQLADAAQRFARVLQDRGLVRGDRVALHLENTVMCAETIFGVWLAGGVVTVVHPQTKTDKLAFILNNAETAFVVTEARTAGVARDAAAQAPSVRDVWTVDELPALLAAASPVVRDPGTIPNDLATLVYTSGTTGHPKG